MKDNFLQEFHSYVHNVTEDTLDEIRRAVVAASLKFQTAETAVVNKVRRGRKPKALGTTLSAAIVDEKGARIA